MKKLIAFLLLLGCDGSWRNLVLDPPPPRPLTVDIVCDAGGGSSGCTKGSLRQVLTTVTLPPGSVVRLHGLTDRVADARELARYEIPIPKKRTRKAIERAQRQATEALTLTFIRASAPLFTARRRESPVAEMIARAALAGGTNQHIIVLTDARHFTRKPRFDLECMIPTKERFAARLRELLPSWRNTNIHFVFVQLEPVDGNRCSATVEHYNNLRTLWTETLTSLGARVTWSMGNLEGALQ